MKPMGFLPWILKFNLTQMVQSILPNLNEKYICRTNNRLKKGIGNDRNFIIELGSVKYKLEVRK